MNERENGLKPKTFGEKLENYWYHYKFHTIVGIFFLVVAIMIVKDVFFKPKYDITLTYVVNGYAVQANPATEEKGDLARLEELFLRYIDDYNGDGKKTVLVSIIELPDRDEIKSTQLYGAMRAKLMGELTAGEISLYVMPQYITDDLEINEAFVELSDKYPQDARCKGIYLDIRDILTEAGIAVNEEDGYMLIRSPELMRGYNEKRYGHDLAFFENFVESTKTNG